MRSSLRAGGVIAAILFAVLFMAIPAKSLYIPPSQPNPSPCASLGAPNCQPIWSPNNHPGPITLVPNTLQLTASGSPGTVAITDPYYSGAFTATASPAYVTTSVIGSTLTVTPGSTANVTAVVTVTDTFGNKATVNVGIMGNTPPPQTPTPSPSPSATPTPMYGAVNVSPGTASFSGPTASPQTFIISQANYGGPWTASPTPASLASAGVSSYTLTLRPNNPGSGVVVITGGNSLATSLPFTVAATPFPTAYPSIAAAVPTITPEPALTAIASPPSGWTAGAKTTQLVQSDKVMDGVGIDTNITQGYGGTRTFGWLCNIGYGTWLCPRYIRDGPVVGTTEPYIADLNFLGTQGVGNFMLVNLYDPSATLTTDLGLYNNMWMVAGRNEPNLDQYGAFLASNTSVGAGPTLNIVNQGNIDLPAGSTVYVGEGPTQETATISSYNSASSLTLSGTLSQAHNGGIHTYTTGVTAGNPVIGQSVPPTPVGLGTPLATPLDNVPGTPLPSPTASMTVTLGSTTGMTAGDYISFGCQSVNAGTDANYEYTQIQSVNSSTSITVAPGLRYTHFNSEGVGEGCIHRVPDNTWGALNVFPIEVQRIAAAAAAAASPVPNGNIAYAFSDTSNAQNPQYGGIQVPLNATTWTQGHSSCSGNCGGSWGDGSNGFGNSHPFCFLQNCSNSSWQWNYSGLLAEGGPTSKIVCTECEWPIVAVGSVGYSGQNNGSALQIPDDVAAAWMPRMFLFELNHNYNRVMQFQLIDGATGFCTDGLIRSAQCGAPYNSVTDTPKAAYWALYDMMGIIADTGCMYPGCTFTPSSITWAWNSLPAVSHGSNYQGTDPGQVRSFPMEKSDGTLLFPYWYEATDYLQSSTTCTGYATTACYQWGGVGANNSAGQPPTIFSDSLYIANAGSWTGCFNVDTDLKSTDANFGHMIPTSAVTFNAITNQATVLIKPEVQWIVCPQVLTTPTVVGTPVPSPTPIASESSTPEPLPPNWKASPTAVPSGFTPGPSPSPSPTALPSYSTDTGVLPTPGMGAYIFYSPSPFQVPACANDPCATPPSFFDPKDSAEVSSLMAGSLTLGTINEGLAADNTMPTYFAKNTDPAYTIYCDGGCGAGSPMTVRIPNGAAASSGSDHHVIVVNQTSGVENDFYQFNEASPNSGGRTTPVTGGGTLYVGSGGNCVIASFAGNVNGCSNAATGSLLPLFPIVLDPREVNGTGSGNGSINHVIYVAVGCAQGTYVFPAALSDGQCGANGPQYGQRIWLDLTVAQINALSIGQWAKTILIGMHQYGYIVSDQNGSTSGIDLEMTDPLTFTVAGLANPWPTFWTNATGSSASTTVNLPTPAAISQANVHILAACVNTNSCPTPTPTSTPPGTATISEADNTGFNLNANLTNMTSASGADWVVFGYAGTSTGFTCKASGAASCGPTQSAVGDISNITQNNGNINWISNPPGQFSAPLISWSDGASPSASYNGLAQTYQIVQYGVQSGTTNPSLTFTTTGTSSLSAYKTILVYASAYCDVVGLSATSNDGSFVPVASNAYSDTLRNNNNGVYAVTYSTSSPSTVVTFVLYNHAGSTNCNGISGNFGIRAVVELPTTAPIPAIPGPITFSPTSVTFTGPTASPTTVAISDPNNTTTFTASPTPAGIASASVSGTSSSGTLTLKPVASGQTTVYINDGTNTTGISVGVATAPPSPSPSPSPTTFPTPIYTNAAPGETYPYAVTLPTPASWTVMVQVQTPQNSGNANAAASTLMSITGAWDLDLGQSNSTAGGNQIANPGTALGPHIYWSVQSLPTYQIDGGATGIVLVSDNAGTLQWYQCTYPGTVTCVTAGASAATGAATTYTGAAGFIGASQNSTTRVMPPCTTVGGGCIWNALMFPVAVSGATQATTVAAAYATSNPYPSPSPSPSPSPTTTPTSPPSGLNYNCTGTLNYASYQYPIWSACFGANTPFHHTYAALLNGGYGTVQAASMGTNYWAQGQNGWNGERGNSGSNLYFVNSSASNTYESGTLACVNGGAGNGCGLTQWLPNGFISQPGTPDMHCASFDPYHTANGVVGYEIDNEGCAGHQTWPNVYASGYYPFGTVSGATGICPGGNGCWGGTAGGYALGVSDITYQEVSNYVTNGIHIGHALALISWCVGGGNGSGVYPAAGKNSDTQCGVSSGATQFSTNNPVYGALIHLKSSVSVPGLTSNAYCQAVLYAMQDYGAYTADTSDSSGVYPYTEGDQGYNLGPFALYNNPWTTNISALGGSLNSYFSGNDGCFSLITSGSDIEVMYLKGNGLPPVQPYWQSTGTPSD